MGLFMLNGVPYSGEGDKSTATVSGNPLTFSTDSAQSARECIIAMEPIQAGSGDPSPTNIRAISGRDSIRLISIGENIFNYNTLELGSISTSDGSETPNNNQNRTPYIEVEASTDYRFLNSGTLRVHQYTAAYGYLGSSLTSGIVTMQATAKYIRIAGNTTNYRQNTMLGIAHDNIPYNFSQTVYGATLNTNTGELIVDTGYIASYNGETLPGEWISDRDVYAAGTTPTTGAQVCYDLATPYTLQLTPIQVYLLQNANNMNVADNGASIKLTYRNGDMATLVDVAAVSDSVNALGKIRYPILKAQSSSTGTYADKIGEIQDTYFGLIQDEKQRAKIVIDDNVIYHCENMNDGEFIHSSSTNTNIYIMKLTVRNKRMTMWTYANGAWSCTNTESTSDSKIFKLYA